MPSSTSVLSPRLTLPNYSQSSERYSQYFKIHDCNYMEFCRMMFHNDHVMACAPSSIKQCSHTLFTIPTTCVLYYARRPLYCLKPTEETCWLQTIAYYFEMLSSRLPPQYCTYVCRATSLLVLLTVLCKADGRDGC